MLKTKREVKEETKEDKEKEIKQCPESVEDCSCLYAGKDTKKENKKWKTLVRKAMIVERQGGESVWMARYKEEGKAKIREQETKQIKARKVEQNQVKDQVGIIMRAIKSFPVEI